MTSAEKVSNALYVVAKVLCVVGGVFCFGLVLGAVGAIDRAPADIIPAGAVRQIILGVAGVGAFVGISGKID